MTRERRQFIARGRVQGVGFRPHVWRLAQALGLGGHVANTSAGVLIEAEGSSAQLDAFAVQLLAQLPPLAQVDNLTSHALPLAGDTTFHIAASQGQAARVRLPPDIAPCSACIAELCDPASRYWRHAFINCTDCGPRYSVTRALPYDRANTTLAGFAQCPACQHDYEHPASRRFHAEPNCCNHCGPRLQYLDACGQPVQGDAIAQALAVLRAGGIVALKSAGGFHLACDAHNASAVANLRQRKQRPAKPLALMVANVASAAQWVTIDSDAAALLQQPARPIVLLPGRDSLLPPEIAPALNELGVMLPATPLHLLLFHEAAGRPAGSGWLAQPQRLTLVMSSGNRSGEPVAIDNASALATLSGIADGYLLHDRPIHARADDSVEKTDALGHSTLRRSRGRVPDALAIGQTTAQAHGSTTASGHGDSAAASRACVLATGSYLKNTPCLLHGMQATPGAHVGDLDNAAACRALEAASTQLLMLHDATPAAIACDNGEHYASQYAARLAADYRVPLISVGHHHAHIGAVCAEHRLTGAVLGLALDGFGVGDDGGAWGGELLRVDGGTCQRVGHLAPLALPGGDAAAREPWRVAAAWLLQNGMAAAAQIRFGHEPAFALLPQQLARRINCPASSSMGRYFDLVAALAGVCQRQSFEGEAAQKLEALAQDAAPLAGSWQIDAANVLQLAHLLGALADSTDAAHSASLWHATLAAALADWLIRSARTLNIGTVALGGGCFANRRLLASLLPLLQQAALAVHYPQAVPAGDGGLALGQAWVARQRLAATDSSTQHRIQENKPCV